MPDTKITALAAITTVAPSADLFPIVDVSDNSMAASGTTKNITVNQLLGAGGTATLASATITGNLTVDTSTLVVNPAGYPDRVGIGTATPARPLDIVGSFQSSLGWVLTGTPAGLGAATRYIGGASTTDSWYYNGLTGGSHIWAFGESTAMTLNSTGLGVGVSPGVGFDLQQTSPMARITGTSTTGYSSLTLRNTGASGRQYGITLGGSGTGTNAGNLIITDDTASATRFVLDSSGNVGIGVTPSANGEKLNANGTIISTNQSIGGFALNQAGFDYSTSTKNLRIFSGTSNATGSSMSFVVGTSTSFLTALTLNSLGDFGVGITSPSYRLHSIVASGADKNIFAAQVSGASNGFEVKWNHATTTLRVIVSNLPTSSAGLASGTLWIDTSAGNTLKVA